MAKYICTVVVETDEARGEKPPTKKMIREAIEDRVPGFVHWDDGYERYIYIRKARVRAIDLD